MNKKFRVALVLVLTLCLLAGCRSKQAEDTTVPSTSAPAITTAPTMAPTTVPTEAPTTTPTEDTTDMTGPDMEDMLPGAEDTIDPSNGANQDTGARSRRFSMH